MFIMKYLLKKKLKLYVFINLYSQNKMPAVPGMYQQAPSCWDRMKLGFMIGFCVGMASGVLFGGYSVVRCVFIYGD